MRAKVKHLHAIISIMISFVLLTASVGALLSVRGNAASAAPFDQSFKTHRVDIQPGIRQIDSLQLNQQKTAATGVKPVQFHCQRDTNPQPVLCYGPYQVREAYGVTDLLTKQITGQGSTITIIDAYGSPTIRQDLKKFDSAWGLPDPQLSIVAPFGQPGSDSTWASETSLDVEWAHVMAPDAAINLVLAKTSNDTDLYNTLSYVVKHNLGDVVSLSFGENEHCVDPKLRLAEHHLLKKAAQKHMTILAATGDVGSAMLTCNSNSYEEAVAFPANDPFVTAVGGTTLTADAVTGRYIHETTWNESDAFNKATGGGYSKIYPAPAYQKGILGAAQGRGLPDLSMNAAVNGGVLVFQGNSGTGRTTVNIMGGTSVAAPEMAGILADGVQLAHHRLGQINPALYKLGASPLYSQAMHDVTSGSNALASSGLTGYTASPGWDPATGWGSPKQAEVFLQALITQG
ncbi:MAG TPA: S53 family peptidase [Ktedonobacteraceae bacterium]|nr:S53 family peptidase [Ktedonobacteraceae bacterium]